MATASFVVGIFAVLLAALSTAPCFGPLMLLGVPVALLGSGLGVIELLSNLRARCRGQDEFPHVGLAVAGVLLCGVSLLWMALLALVLGKLWL